MAKLALASVLEALREEMTVAQKEGDGKGLRFNVNNVEVELQTAIDWEVGGEGGGKIKFWVFDVDAKGTGKYKNANMHKIKLNLEVVDEKDVDPETGKARHAQLGGDN